MYNVVISSLDKMQDIGTDRYFEYTDPKLAKQFKTSEGAIDFEKLHSIPTIFTPEFSYDSLDSVQIGFISPTDSNAIIQSPFIPTFPAKLLYKYHSQFNIKTETWENSHTHWAVKPGNLFKMLSDLFSSAPEFRNLLGSLNNGPMVPDRIAVMMPFDQKYKSTADTIRKVCENSGYKAERVDDHSNPGDIVVEIKQLIRTSPYVIADLSDLKPNVCYEVGYAHALRKPTIIITSTPSATLPFDIAHMRYISYENNGEGHVKLQHELSAAVESLKSIE